MSGSRQRARARIYWGTAVALVVLGGVLRAYCIGDAGVWFDEALSLFRATSPEATTLVSVDPNPPLYYLLLRGWVSLAGTSEAGLRGLSALCGILFVAGAILAGRYGIHPGAGLFAGAVAAISPLAIYYSQEARAYALLVLALLLAQLAFTRAVARGTRGAWYLAALAAALSVHTHYLAVLALLAEIPLALLWIARGPRWPRMRSVAEAGGVALLLGAPWAFLDLQHHAAGIDRLEWIRRVSGAPPPWWAIPSSVAVLSLGIGTGHLPVALKQFSRLAFPEPLRYAALASLLLLGGVAATSWRARFRGTSGCAIPLWLHWARLLVPLLALSGVSLIKPIYLVGRYDVVALPGAVTLLGSAFWRLSRMGRVGPWLTVALSLGVAIPIGVKLERYYELARSSGQVPKRTAELLAKNVRDGGWVVSAGPRLPLATLYYLQRLGYRCDEGACRDLRSKRRFHLRHQGGALQADSLRFEPHRVSNADVWVVFRPFLVERGRYRVSKEGVELVDALRDAGFEPATLSPSTGAFRFRRMETGATSGSGFGTGGGPGETDALP